jgi:hypothetical protein
VGDYRREGAEVSGHQQFKAEGPGCFGGKMPENMRSLIDYPEIVPSTTARPSIYFCPRTPSSIGSARIRYFNAALQQEFILEKDY